MERVPGRGCFYVSFSSEDGTKNAGFDVVVLVINVGDEASHGD